MIARAGVQLVDRVQISWSPPLLGRLDPATVMAIPDSTSDSASTVRNSSSSTVPGWCSTACAAVRASVTASPSTGSPVSAAASSQSAIADRLLTTSPIPDRTSRGGPERTRSRSTITATGGTTPYEPLPDSCSSELIGEAMPSWARLVATATIGIPAMCGGELGHVEGLAAADARDGLVGVGPQPLAQRDRAVHRAVLDPEDLGRSQVQVGEHAVALAGADRDGDPALRRDPPVGEQRAQVRDRAPPHVDDERRGEDAGQQRHGRPSGASRQNFRRALG